MGRRKRQKKVSLGGSAAVQTFEGPAKLNPGHMIERVPEDSIGTIRRFRNTNCSSLLSAYEREQITEEQFSAGHTFEVLFEKMSRSGRDSTLALETSRGGGMQTPYLDTQARAIRSIRDIERKMSGMNYRLVRLFCGEGYGLAAVVKRVTVCHPSGRGLRMQEALNELIETLDALLIHRADTVRKGERVA